MKKGRCLVLRNKKIRIFIDAEIGNGDGFSVEREITGFDDVSFLTALSETADMFLKYLNSEINQNDQHTESVSYAESAYTYLSPQYTNNYVKIFD